MEPTYLENEYGCKARIVADSINTMGDRVTSFEVETHRFTLAEWNTHCLFARNSASSRAIPIDKQLDRYDSDPAYPIKWPCEKPGMQGGDLLTGRALTDAMNLWDDIHEFTRNEMYLYVQNHRDPKERLHKSLLNRLLEPMQWHTMLITSANYENFFDLRVSETAMPEFHAVAALMKELFEKSTPTHLIGRQWHVPYVREDEMVEGTLLLRPPNQTPNTQETVAPFEWDVREISSSRCAATSYVTQWADKPYEKEIERYNGLTENGHWSPLEHVCTPWSDNVMHVNVPDPDNCYQSLQVRTVAKLGKFKGWLQWRHVVEARNHVNTYR